jgi:hypothetical protein
VALQGFAHLDVERLYRDGAVPRRAGWAGISRIVTRKLDVLDYH